MNFLKVSLLSFLLSLNAQIAMSASGDEGPHGGDGVMVEEAMQTLDMLEKSEALDISSLPFITLVSVYEDIAQIAPHTGRLLKSSLLENTRWFLTDSDISNITDEGEIGVVIKEGELYQLAANDGSIMVIQKSSWTNDLEVQIDLLNHENTWAVAFVEGVSGDTIRTINRLLLTEKDNERSAASFLEVLSQYVPVTSELGKAILRDLEMQVTRPRGQAANPEVESPFDVYAEINVEIIELEKALEEGRYGHVQLRVLGMLADLMERGGVNLHRPEIIDAPIASFKKEWAEGPFERIPADVRQKFIEAVNSYKSGLFIEIVNLYKRLTVILAQAVYEQSMKMHGEVSLAARRRLESMLVSVSTVPVYFRVCPGHGNLCMGLDTDLHHPGFFGVNQQEVVLAFSRLEELNWSQEEVIEIIQKHQERLRENYLSSISQSNFDGESLEYNGYTITLGDVTEFEDKLIISNILINSHELSYEFGGQQIAQRICRHFGYSGNNIQLKTKTYGELTITQITEASEKITFEGSNNFRSRFFITRNYYISLFSPISGELLAVPVSTTVDSQESNGVFRTGDAANAFDQKDKNAIITEIECSRE